MLRFVFSCFFSVIALQGWGQPRDSLIDSQTHIGTLENGLTYYIRENRFPAQKAYLALVVKVGSLHENESERGAAHFIEHLNFRGSRHFEDGEIIRYLESIGAWFGTDANAYTTFESTTYKLEVPLDREKSMERAFLILRDFAGNATLSEEAVEKERHVVLDELRQQISSSPFRLLEKTLDTFIPESSLSQRFPVGTEEIVSTLSPAALRAFYERGYRADRMAVVAVGDFDAKSVQKTIEDLFSDMAPSEETFPDPMLKISQDSPKTLRYFDPELPYSRVFLTSYFLSPDASRDSPSEVLKKNVLSNLIEKCFQKRLSQLQQKGLSLQAFAGEGAFLSNGMSVCTCGSILLNDSCEEGIKAFHRTRQSILKEGFTNEEWSAARAQFLEESKQLRNNLDLTVHESFAIHCMNHFLKGAPILSLERSYAERTELANTLSLEEGNAYLAETHFKDPFHILFATSDQKVYEQISEESLKALFEPGASDPIAESEEAPRQFAPLSPTEEGMIIDAKLGDVSEWTLGNQMKVLLKKTELERDRVILLLCSKRGLKHLPEEDFVSGKMMVDYLWRSSFKGLTQSEFTSYLKSRGMGMGLALSLNETAVSLSSSREHLEEAFQVIHELFSNFQFDRAQWDPLVKQCKEQLREAQKNPDTAFQHYLNEKTTQNHYFFRPLDLSSADAAKAETLASTYFGAPQEFTMIVVGDFEEKSLEALTKKYLASLAPREKKELPEQRVSSFFPDEKVEEVFASGNHSYEKIVITIPFDSQGLHLNTLAASKLMDLRLSERLRWQKGGTYGVHASFNLPFSPFLNAGTVQIVFTCQNKDCESMIKTVFEEIEKWKTELCSEEEINTLKQLLLKERKQATLSNLFWVLEISRLNKLDLPFDSLNAYEEEIDSITPERVKSLAQRLFASPYSSTLIHTPANPQRR